MQTKEQMRELDHWILKNVFGWVDYVEEEFPHRVGFSKGDECGEKMLAADMPEFTTDASAAMEVLRKCVEKAKGLGIEHNGGDRHSLVGIYAKAEATGETLELAICLFARELFSK